MDTHDAQKRSLAQQAEMLKELGYHGAGHLWLPGLAERLATLDAAGLRLVTAEGRIMPLRFTGKASDCNGQIAHVDIHQGLPAEAAWRRR